MVFILFLFGFVLHSPFFSYLGLRWALISCLYIVGIVVFSGIKKRSINKRVILFILLILTTTLFSAIYWMSYKIIAYQIHFIAALLLVSQSTFKEIDKLVEISTYFLMLQIIGGYIGLSLAFYGISPNYAFVQPGIYFAEIFVLPFTFLIKSEGFYRACGIYGEPGTLAFLIIVVAYLRIVLKKNFRITWLLLFGGFISSSLAYLAVFVLFIFFQTLSIKRTFNILPIVFLIIFLLINSPLSGVITDSYSDRLIITGSDDRLISGDNRTILFKRAYEFISSNYYEVLAFGVNPNINIHFIPKMDNNFLSPLAYKGMFFSWVYYAYILLGIWLVFVKKSSIELLGIILLLLQRPYLQSFGYSLLLIICLSLGWGNKVPTLNYFPKFRLRR